MLIKKISVCVLFLFEHICIFVYFKDTKIKHDQICLVCIWGNLITDWCRMLFVFGLFLVCV